MLIIDPSLGSINTQIEEDPRLSESQRLALLKAAKADPTAEVVGIDAQVRPVIRARHGGARKPSTYAVMRGGQPTAVTEPVEETWD